MAYSRAWIRLSVLISILVYITSLLGILDPTVYSKETMNWALQAKGQDAANLLAASILLISSYFFSRKSFRAYLVWLGVYIYLIYSFVIYSFSVHFNYLFPMYVSILGLSFYTPLGTILSNSSTLQTKKFNSDLSIRPASILLLIIGIFFGFLWICEISMYITTGNAPQSFIDTKLWTNPVHVLDLGFILPGMIMTSILLWRKQKLGYIFVVPFLVFFLIVKKRLLRYSCI